MGLTYGFFNSLNGDRKYDATQLSSIFEGIITQGVFRNVGDALNVVASTPAANMFVNVGIGRAWFEYIWVRNTELLPLEVAPAHASWGRKDILVLEVDTRDTYREASFKIITGTPSSSPADPAVLLTGDHIQHPIARITVAAMATSITEGNIQSLIGVEGTLNSPYITILDAAAEIGDRVYTVDKYITPGLKTLTAAIDEVNVASKDANTAAQTAINNFETTKQPTITGGASTITGDNLTAGKALVSNGSGKVAVSAVTSNELGFLAGVTSAIQAQINALVTVIVVTANRVLISNGSGNVAASNVTTTELGYLSGVTSGIQGQIDSISGAIVLTASRLLVTNAQGGITASAVNSTEAGYLSGVTGAIQTQLNGKQPSITGAATTITGSNLTANRVLASDASGKVAAAAVTTTELGALTGLTGAIQTQLDGKLGSTAAAADTLKIGGFKITVGVGTPAGAVAGDLWIDTN
jgi:hypothetical protein